MTLLRVEGLSAGYGGVRVVRDLSIEAEEGEVVVILGANGAGKTTTMRAISGMVECQGEISFDDHEITQLLPHEIVELGIVHVPQGRGTFADLSVEENLLAGAFTRRDSDIARDLSTWMKVFPRLDERRGQTAGTLSGGEQQMLALARAMMARPKLLLLDEPSLGLAPIVTQDLFTKLVDLNRSQGLTVVIVEQNANLALDAAHRAYVLDTGRIVASGTSDQLKAEDSVRRAYLGY